MVRPRKIKTIDHKPDVTYFKPRATPLSRLEEIELTLDELETLRLSNLEKLNQIESAEKMDIHQSTFQRTLVRAREKITDALVNGKAIKINGGEYKMPGGDGTGPRNVGSRGSGLGRGFGNGRGFNRVNNNQIGIGGICYCPDCNYEEAHQRGQPCNLKKCPKCGSNMVRKN